MAERRPSAEQVESAGNGGLLQCAIDTDTSSAPPVEQFDLFRSWYVGVAEPLAPPEGARSFPAHQQVWSIGPLTLMHLALPNYLYRYRHLRNPFRDDWYLAITLPKDRNHGGRPEFGRMSVQSLVDPLDSVSEDNESIAVIMPRDLPFIQDSRIAISEHFKDLLGEYVVALHRTLASLKSADVEPLARATNSLLAACLAPSRDHVAEARRPIEAVIMRRASKLIAEHLADPELTPEFVCREIGISRSSLYRIFEPVGGISSHIRRMRLRKTRDALASATDGRTISAIAEKWGFTDPSSYSRLFRREFGMSPRELRAEGRQGEEFVSPADDAHLLRNLLLRTS